MAKHAAGCRSRRSAAARADETASSLASDRVHTHARSRWACPVRTVTFDWGPARDAGALSWLQALLGAGFVLHPQAPGAPLFALLPALPTRRLEHLAMLLLAHALAALLDQ